ncbi:MAG: glycosyltransferase family 4 protein [Clostridia bacterium]|nr:glycosyltransferase family 4 protein [Clostridia bacterium]
MKIMFYINSIHHGGAERVITNLANEFSVAGNEVILVTSFKSEKEYVLLDTVKRVSLFDSYIKGALKRNLRLVKGLRKTMKAENPDVIVSFMAEPNFRTIIASRRLKAKVFLSVRNDPNREYGNFLFRFLAKRLFKRADGVIFQTEDAKAWFPKKIQDKSRVIFNQVDKKFFDVQKIEDAKDIITVGRLVPQKRHDVLIKAFSKICDKVDGNLVIYGEGNQRAELEGLIKSLNLEERVKLPGLTSDVPRVLSQAKMFVLSSDYEGMPNALMEAMAVGLPCISTDCPCGGPRELFDGDGGILVPTGDIDCLATTMLEFYRDEKRMGEISVNAKEKAKEFYPTSVFKRWEDYLFNC